ncbi:hypothetical protein Tco_1314596 [Tanacetum coccineum]
MKELQGIETSMEMRTVKGSSSERISGGKVVHDKKFNQGTIYTFQGSGTEIYESSRKHSRPNLDEIEIA